MAGNVFEWCLDYFEAYKGKEIMNRRVSQPSGKRVYRGGSWKSRMGSLRASARHFNMPNYSSNDVGFRVVCECE
jgi:formylglycine-generating enzyme required for sulfatase activity